MCISSTWPVILSLLSLSAPSASLAADEGGFQLGDVFAAGGGGRIQIFNQGRLRRTLRTPSGEYLTGMCFDLEDNLYATDFKKSKMSKFDKEGRLLVADWGGPFSKSPESCVVDGKGNVYTGEVRGENHLRKFDSSGRLLASFKPRVEKRGVDWIDLAADQCTMFYTSEGSLVMRYDVCRARQLADFARGLSGGCFALRLRKNGELMVACEERVYRLASNGSVRQTYPIAGESLFAMNLDPDGEHFWTGGIQSGAVYRIHIGSGRGTARPLFTAIRGSGSLLRRLETYTATENLGGLTVYGERTAALSDVEEPDEERQSARRAEAARNAQAQRLAEAKRERAAAEGLAEAERARLEAERLAEAERRRREADRRAEAERRDEEAERLAEAERRREAERAARAQRIREEAERRRRAEEERRRRLGRVTFGPPRAVDFGSLAPDSEAGRPLDLSGTRLEGAADARVTSTLEVSGLTLEIETPQGWRALGSRPVVLSIEHAGRRDWPLRLRASACPSCLADGEAHYLLIEAPGLDQTVAQLRVPLSVEVEEASWLQCWWPALMLLACAAALGILVYGLVSPSRFSAQAGLVLSPEEDMSEGHFHPLRAQRGSRSGFYRDARLYVIPSYRVSGRSAGAVARLRADDRQVRIQPMFGASLYRLTADGDWDRLPDAESRMASGAIYRDDLGNLFFELRSV